MIGDGRLCAWKGVALIQSVELPHGGLIALQPDENYIIGSYLGLEHRSMLTSPIPFHKGHVILSLSSIRYGKRLNATHWSRFNGSLPYAGARRFESPQHVDRNQWACQD